MADTDKLEQQFLDGTHPALHRAGSPSAAKLRHADSHQNNDPTDDHSHGARKEDEEDEDAPRFSAIDPDPPSRSDTRPPPLRETTNNAQSQRRRGEESRNTGVKGVKADYAEAMLHQRQRQEQEQDLARRIERGLNLAAAATPTESAAQEQDELDRLRQRRLAQLQGSGERAAGRTFGHLSEVGIEGFVAAVEDEDPETAVVVHLYEPDISTCAILNSHLASLARSHPRTKFLRAQASEVDFMQQQATTATSSDAGNAGDATLPTVLVYRAGELETVWVRFDFECPGGKIERGPKGLAAVEDVLSSAGVVVVSSSRRSADVSDDDDDDDD